MQSTLSIRSFITILAAGFSIAPPVTAALVTFGYDAEVTGYYYDPGSAVSETAFSGIYATGTPASVSLTIDYDGNLDHFVMTAYEINIAGHGYRMTSTNNQTVTVQNNHTLASIDWMLIETPEVSGPLQGASNPYHMEFSVTDNSPTQDQLFASDVPTLLEIVNIASPPYQSLVASIGFEDFDGFNVGRYFVSNNGRPISVSVEDARPSEVPLPAAFPLMLSGFIGMAALLTRRRVGCK